MLVDRKFVQELALEFMEDQMGRECAEALIRARVAVDAMEQAPRYPNAEFREEDDDERAISEEHEQAEKDFEAALRLFLKRRLAQKLA